MFDFGGKNPDVDSMSFLNDWPKYAAKIRAICEQDECLFNTGWSDNIENVLLLLKLFPIKVKRNKSKPFHEPVLESIEKFIVFALVKKLS